MSFHTESEYSESNELLVSRLSNVHIMANILKAIHFKDVSYQITKLSSIRICYCNMFHVKLCNTGKLIVNI